MTSKARHPASAAELRVRVAHDLNHLASGLLRGLIVLFPLVLDVTMSAVNAKRRLEREHDFHQAVRRDALEQLDVLVFLLGALFFAARRKRIKRRKLRAFFFQAEDGIRDA